MSTIQDAVDFRSRNQDTPGFGHDFDTSGLDLAIGPGVVPAKKGGEFGGTKNDLFGEWDGFSEARHGI